MIVVGILLPGAASADSAVEIARRGSATGARIEMVGVAPAGAVGDRLLLQLAEAGIGHATVTRSAASGIEPADLELALRYLPDVRVIVLIQPGAALLATAAAAAAWSGAALIVVAGAEAGAAAPDGGAAPSGGEPAGVEPIVLEAPPRDPEGAFSGLVAALATRIDAGEPPADAWRATLTTLAVDPA